MHDHTDSMRCIIFVQLQRIGSALLASAQSVRAHLDLCKMSLLLTKANLANLGVHQYTDDGGLLPELLQISLNALATIRVLLAVVAEGLLLALVPVCTTPIKSPHNFWYGFASGKVLLAGISEAVMIIIKPTETCVCWSTATYDWGKVSFFLSA